MMDHVVLCGLGKVGFSVLELLHRLRLDVVVVTRDVNVDWLRRAQTMAKRLMLADARADDALQGADIEKARALIVATDDDLINLEIAMDARRLAPHVPVVVRLFDMHLAQRVQRDLGVRAVLNSATLAAPAFIAAALGDRFVRAFEIGDADVDIMVHEVTPEEERAGATLEAFCAGHRAAPLGLRRGPESDDREVAPAMPVRAGDQIFAALARKQASDGGTAAPRPRKRRFWQHPPVEPLLLARRIWKATSAPFRLIIIGFNIMLLVGVIVFHTRMELSWIDALYFTITLVTTVGLGDIHLSDTDPLTKLFGCAMMVIGMGMMVVAFGIVTDYLLKQRFRQALGKPKSTLENHIVIVGLGRLGHRLANRFHEMGYPVLAIHSPEHEAHPNLLGDDVPVLEGDANDPAVLEQAAIERARAVVAVTDKDIVNVHVAHNAETANPKTRSVVRLFNSSFAAKLGPDVLGIDIPINPSEVAAETFVASALASNVLKGFTIDNHLLMLRWLDRAKLPACHGRTVAEVRGALGIAALMRRHEGASKLDVLAPGDRIEHGDGLIVIEEYRVDSRVPVCCGLLDLGAAKRHAAMPPANGADAVQETIA